MEIMLRLLKLYSSRYFHPNTIFQHPDMKKEPIHRQSYRVFKFIILIKDDVSNR